MKLGPPKKLLCCPHPTKIWKLGRSVDFFFFFFFFLRTVRELSFPIFFKKFLNGENSGGMQSKRIYTSAFLSHWIQILANSLPKSDIKKINKKKTTLFFRILRSVGRGQHNNFFFGLILPLFLIHFSCLFFFCFWNSYLVLLIVVLTSLLMHLSLQKECKSIIL